MLYAFRSVTGRSLTVSMPTLAIFQAGSLTARAKLAAVLFPIFAYRRAGGKFAIAIRMRTVFFHG
jgi:hypothetical protein